MMVFQRFFASARPTDEEFIVTEIPVEGTRISDCAKQLEQGAGAGERSDENNLVRPTPALNRHGAGHWKISR
jgi:hypothetical protein